MFDSSRRRLLHALILSLFIHALILLEVVYALPIRLAVPATLNVVVSTDIGRAAVKPPLTTAAMPAPQRPRVAAEPKRRQLLAEKSAVEVSASAQPQLIPPDTVVVPSAPAVNVAVMSAAQVSAATGPPALSSDALNAEDLRQYRLSLAISARRFKHYPALARERGWEGTAEVVLGFSPRRPETEVILVRSSGHAALDRQAQEMMAQAVRTTALPQGLKERDFRISLPIQFSLEADQ